MTDTTFDGLENDELLFVFKSLSISYTVLSEKLDRVKGRHYEEALNDFDVCGRALTKAKEAASARRLEP